MSLFEHQPGYPDPWVQVSEPGRFYAIGDGDRLDIIYHPELDVANSVLYQEVRSEFVVKTGLQYVVTAPAYFREIDYSADIADLFGDGELMPVNSLHELWVHPKYADRPHAQWPRKRNPL